MIEILLYDIIMILLLSSFLCLIYKDLFDLKMLSAIEKRLVTY